MLCYQGYSCLSGGVDGGWLDWDNCTVLDGLIHSILYFVPNLHPNIYIMLFNSFALLCKYAIKINENLLS